MAKMHMKKFMLRDFAYCLTCRTFVPRWQFGNDMALAGHGGHKWRAVSRAQKRAILSINVMQEIPAEAVYG